MVGAELVINSTHKKWAKLLKQAEEGSDEHDALTASQKTDALE